MLNETASPAPIRYVDLFCGIGGFRVAVQSLSREHTLPVQCVFSSDIDEDCQEAYAANFGEKPAGDITQVKENSVPAHDLLMGGFPCQPFSIIGSMKGFDDTRGTLFFDIARILKAKRPAVFILENVKLLVGHNRGKTLERILQTLREDLGYHAEYRVLNALDFGLPQKRERVFIAGFASAEAHARFQWPEGGEPMRPLSELLEKKVDRKHYASDHIRSRRLSKLSATHGEPTIWHENKNGHVSAYPFSCALRAGASYNYLLVNGERRLTPREMLRLQGFPDDFKIVCKDWQTRKQAGNSVPVNVVRAVAERVFAAQGWIRPAPAAPRQGPPRSSYAQAKITNGRKARASLSA